MLAQEKHWFKRKVERQSHGRARTSTFPRAHSESVGSCSVQHSPAQPGPGCEQDCQNGIVLEEIRGSAKSCSHSLCKHKHTPEDASAKCVRCAAAALAQIQNRLTPKAVQRQAAACVVLAQHSPNTSSAARLKVSCFHGLPVLHKVQDMHRRRCLQDPSLK
jgi:hypothetical protein